MILKLEALWTSERDNQKIQECTLYIDFSIFTLSATKKEREMVVINCPIFTSINLVSWLHQRGQLLQISIRKKKHKTKILFDVTSDEIWYKRGIHISCLWTNRVGKIYKQECEIYVKSRGINSQKSYRWIEMKYVMCIFTDYVTKMMPTLLQADVK